MRKLTTEEFIEKIKKIHGDKYDYSKIDYKGNKVKVCFICPIHGEFWQRPNDSLYGMGCPKCGGTNKMTTEDFIKKAQIVHNNFFSYEKTIYKNSNEKVIVTCPIHGDFEVKANNHLNGVNCKQCQKEKITHQITKLETKNRSTKTYNTEDFIKKVKEVHRDKYDYSKVEYINFRTKVCIICPEHGEFEINPGHLLKGQGCAKCSKNYQYNNAEIIENFKQIHGDKYDYSKVEYISTHTKVCIICPEHGEFWQTPANHLREQECPKCYKDKSKIERELFDFIKETLTEDTVVEENNRIILEGKEIDVYVPSKNIGFEINGLIWHSDRFNIKEDYHLNKTLKCSKKGVHLIHIFEDEWLNKKEIVLSKISHILGCENKLKIFGRKTEIKTINRIDGIDFLNKYHIQGSGIASVYLGCFYKQNLIAVMSFKKEKENSWELTRFASDYNYICCGVGGKLFKHFIKEYDPQVVKSFADRRWTVDEENNLYIQLGFKFDGYTRPDYKYIKSGSMERYHKFNFRKEKLLKKYPDVLNPNMTEKEMTKELGYYKIYDCGLIRYIWKKN